MTGPGSERRPSTVTRRRSSPRSRRRRGCSTARRPSVHARPAAAPGRVRRDGPQRGDQRDRAGALGPARAAARGAGLRAAGRARPRAASACTRTSTGRSSEPGAGGLRGGALAIAVAAGFDAVKVAPFDGLRWEPEQDRARSPPDRRRAGPDRRGPRRGRAGRRCADRLSRAVQSADCDRGRPPRWRRSIRTGSRRPSRSATSKAGGASAIPPAPDWPAGSSWSASRRTGGSSRRPGSTCVMPDVKYCGGIGGLAQVTALAASFGTEVAPHNPSGPVATAATAHAALAPATPQIVEFAWGETSWRSELVGGGETIEGGRIRLDGRPGLGSASTRSSRPAIRSRRRRSRPTSGSAESIVAPPIGPSHTYPR